MPVGHKRRLPAIKIGDRTFPLCRLADGRLATRYRDGSRRVGVTARTAEALRAKLERVCVRLENRATDAAGIEARDALIFQSARDHLAPLALDVDRAARLLVEAVEVAGGLEALLPAVRRGRTRGPLHQRPAAEVVAHFLRSLAGDGASRIYEAKSRADLERFAASFPGPLSERTGAEMDTWLRDLRRANGSELSRRRRRNLRDTLVTLFRFARAHGYLDDGLITEAEKIKRPKVARVRPPIYTPEELQLLIEQCHQPEDTRRGRHDCRPFLAPLTIAAFAGLRWSEIARLQWRDVYFDANEIEVSEDGKTGRRLVPIVPTLAAWLADFRHAHGPVLTFPRQDHIMRRLRERAGLSAAGYSNALRHSFITYRVALTKNLAQVAMEAGNSVGEIKRSYLNPQIGKVAERWFAIAPTTGEKVVQMPLGVFKSA